ncbi:MAG: hypothetical protein WA102_03275 [Candidatus Methanoperedens sp.]
MTFLSSINILQRIFEGLEEDDLKEIKDQFSPSKSEINTLELAEVVLNLDNEGRRKFTEIIKIDKKELRRIAEDSSKILMDDKRKKSENDKLPILFDSLDFGRTRPANIDLRLGDEYFVSREKHPKRLEETGGYVVIEPGDFAILITYEYMYVPDDLVGFINLRNKYKKSGLINISGFHVDPGYFGKLLFSVYNAGPGKVVLKHKEPVFMIMYDKLKDPVLKGYGEGYENITGDVISGLIGHSVSPVRLKARIDSLEMQLRILMAIGIAVVVARIAKVI